MQSHGSTKVAEDKSTLNYAFFKPSRHFKKEEIEDTKVEGRKYHRVKKLQKKFKPGSTLERNSSCWYKIDNKITHPKFKSRLNRIIVLCGELFRLLDENLPKTRVVQDGKSEFPISKEVKDATIFANAFIGNRPIYKEGMGRGFLGKFFYQDIDVHGGNSFVTEDDYLVVFDHDRCFPTITRKMHTDNKSNWSVRLKQTFEDYQNFPMLDTYYPNIWVWRDCYEAVTIAKNTAFLNEKHFTTLKLIATESLQNALIEHHIVDKEDKVDLTKRVKAQIKNFVEFCKLSDPFKTYLKNNHIDILNAIIYEVFSFFKTNKHYTTAFGRSCQRLVSEFSDDIIKSYSDLLVELKEAPISDKEQTDLKKFIVNIDKYAVVQKVKSFYLNQAMHRHAMMLDEKYLNVDFSKFFLEWGENKLKLNQFIKNLLAQFKPYSIDPLQAFFEYAAKNHKDVLGELIELVTDIHQSDFLINDLSPFHLSFITYYSIAAKKLDIAKSLLKTNPEMNLNICDRDNKSYAIQFLLEDKQPDKSFIRSLYEEVKTPVSLKNQNKKNETALYTAIINGHYDIAEYFIKLPTFSEQLTLHQIARAALRLIEAKQYTLGNILLEKIRDDILYYAMHEDKLDISVIRYLCEEVKPVIDLSKPNQRNNKIAIWYAAHFGRDEITNYFLESPDLLKQFPKGKLGDALLVLVNEGKNQFVISLLDKRPDIELNEVEYETVLSIAVDLGNWDLVNYFINKPELIKQFTPGQLGRVLIDLVPKYPEYAMALITARPDIDADYWNIDEDTTALKNAVNDDKPNMDLIQTLCEKATIHPQLVVNMNINVLSDAIAKQHYDLVAYFINSPDLIKPVEPYHIGVAICDLMFNKQFALMNLLLKKRPDADLKSASYKVDCENNSILHLVLADEKPNLDLIKKISALKPEKSDEIDILNKQNNTFKSPLRIAIDKGSREILEVMLPHMSQHCPPLYVLDAIQCIRKPADMAELVSDLTIFQNYSISLAEKRIHAYQYVKALLERSKSPDEITKVMQTLLEREKRIPFLKKKLNLKRFQLFVGDADEWVQLQNFAKNKLKQMSETAYYKLM